MAKLTDVYRTEGVVNIGRRQIPVVTGGDSSLMILMDLGSKGLAIDSPQIRGKELEEFTRKFNLLTNEELVKSLEIDSTTFIALLNQCVQCVGCRRRVERLFYQLTLSGHPTLDPLVLKKSCILTVNEEKLKTPQALGTLLYRHHEVLNNLLDNKLRNKTRCILHSLDAFRSKPFSETWREVWLSMKNNCRTKLAVIETKELHEVLDNYLKKHKFCQGCRTKIEKAYKILVGEITTKEKGFVAALYANIKKCHAEKHIHIIMNKFDFLDALIRRAEPEVNGSYSKQRERHAKTLEIAQEEVLTCVGMIMYERLRRIYVSLREEERACQVLAAVGVHALCRSFDMAVEAKQGISNLELLYQQISRAEKAKELKREQKKLKKKQKKNEKKFRTIDHTSMLDADSSDAAEADEEPDEAVELSADDDDDDDEDDVYNEIDGGIDEDNVNSVAAAVNVQEANVEVVVPSGAAQSKKKKNSQKQKQKKSGHKQKIRQHQQQQHKAATLSSPIVPNSKCNDCLAPTSVCPCDVKDFGYGSEPNSHNSSRTSSAICSPEGSEISCSDGFCNHEHGVDGVHDLDDEQHTIHHQQQNTENESCELLLCHQQHLNWLSLQQMLNDSDEYEDDNEENCYIPQEVVLEYQCHREQVQKQRQELRETLRQNFARLCTQKSIVSSDINCK